MAAFVQATHPPKTYLLFTGLWALSLLAVLRMLAGQGGFAGADLLAALSFFLVLLFLRAVDEIKDLDYDRIHKPDRPLVRGVVSVAEVAALAGVVALLVLALNLALSPWLALFAALNMAYGLVLLALERLSRRLREGILLNLLITFPVSAALNVYAWLYLFEQGSPSLVAALPVLLAYVCAALHFEFGRKLKWPVHAATGENGYAQRLGAGGAVAACVLLGLAAVGLMAWGLREGGWGAWLPCAALLPSVLGLKAFFAGRQRHEDLKSRFALFLVVFYSSAAAGPVWA